MNMDKKYCHDDSLSNVFSLRFVMNSFKNDVCLLATILYFVKSIQFPIKSGISNIRDAMERRSYAATMMLEDYEDQCPQDGGLEIP